MALATANLLASLFTLVVAIAVAAWYLAPALRRRPLADALTLLLWFHAFRYIALQIFSAAEVGGLQASTSAQRAIAFGDAGTAALAIVTLVVLRRRLPVGRALAWGVALVGTADLVSATVVGIQGNLTDTATDWSWMILAVYVPVLWVTTVMLIWQLVSRRREPVALVTGSAVAAGAPGARST